MITNTTIRVIPPSDIPVGAAHFAVGPTAVSYAAISIAESELTPLHNLPVLAGERAAHLTRRMQRDPYSAAARLTAGRFFVWLLAFHETEAKREAKLEAK